MRYCRAYGSVLGRRAISVPTAIKKSPGQADARDKSDWDSTSQPHELQYFSNSHKLYSMQATLTVNGRGVVTLPAKLRRAMGLKADDQLIAETTAQGLLLRPVVTLPVELYSDERVQEFDAAEAELADLLRKR